MDPDIERALSELTDRVRNPPTLDEALHWLELVSAETYRAREYAAVIRQAVQARASRPA